MNPVAEHAGKELPEPRAAGKDVAVGLEFRTVFAMKGGHRVILQRTGSGRGRAVFAAGLFEGVTHGDACAPRFERAGAAFEPYRLHAAEVDLRIAPRRLGEREV